MGNGGVEQLDNMLTLLPPPSPPPPHSISSHLMSILDKQSSCESCQSPMICVPATPLLIMVKRTIGGVIASVLKCERGEKVWERKSTSVET